MVPFHSLPRGMHKMSLRSQMRCVQALEFIWRVWQVVAGMALPADGRPFAETPLAAVRPALVPAKHWT